MQDKPWDESVLADNFHYDYKRYSTHSFVSTGTTREHRRAIIRILTHYIEGGMSFPDVRLGYGREKIDSILDKLDRYISDFGHDETVAWALATITDYLAFHKERGHAVDDVANRLHSLQQRHDVLPAQGGGGSETVTREQIAQATDFDFSRFLVTRHSVRQYADGPVDDETIRRIVTNAQECPNVCNRQTAKVYAFNDRPVVQELLEYQAGNAGFRQEIQTLFIVTANIAHMNLIGERYQGWIDGGIFAMTLALSIHAEGLGACFLNWSVEKEQDLALRQRVGIPDNEIVITMMSAGHLKERFRVPVSARKPLRAVLALNPPLAQP
ncbi:nitroreductase family protein [Hoeflea sp.]|uniref:nitroreductase family protein n=1 Tax=Hoeflea sp. TaxID=1940281 RepID=UPI003B0151F1